MNAIDIDKAMHRYRTARNTIGKHSSDGYVRTTQLGMKPLHSRFEEARIFMGSHIDQNPDTADRVEVWNSRRENGKELIVQEVFVESKERIGWSWSKTPVLHVFHHALHAPGNVFVGAAFATIDLTTGKAIRSLDNDEEAARKIEKLDLWAPKRYGEPHDPGSMAGWQPEPVPDYVDPEELEKNRDQVIALHDGFLAPGGLVQEGKSSVTIGNVKLPRRGAAF